jgi:hypothetical protein
MKSVKMITILMLLAGTGLMVATPAVAQAAPSEIVFYVA